jgi:hypothetical protein
MPVIKDPSKRNRNAQITYGCDEAEAIRLNQGRALRDQDSLAMAYATQRHAAHRRGIEWKFTFSEWLSVWGASGQLHRRGVGRGSYCMARHGDVGPYEVSNVSIALCIDNSRDGRASRFV